MFHADDGGDARDASDYIVDLREYDVPYYMRVAIDRGINVDERFMLMRVMNRN